MQDDDLQPNHELHSSLAHRAKKPIGWIMLVAFIGWLLVVAGNVGVTPSLVAFASGFYFELVLAWSALIAPQQWKTLLCALLYIACLAATQVFMIDLTIQSSRTLITIDLADILYPLAIGWFMLKLASLVTGIEFSNKLIQDNCNVTQEKLPPFWTISRLLYVMVCVAMTCQFLVLHARWYANLMGDPATFSNVLGPIDRSGFEATQLKLIELRFMAIASQFVIPVMLACWLACGTPRRWLLLPGSVALSWIVEFLVNEQANRIAKADLEIRKYWEWIDIRTIYANLLGGPLVLVLLSMLGYILLAALTPTISYAWRKTPTFNLFGLRRFFRIFS